MKRLKVLLSATAIVLLLGTIGFLNHTDDTKVAAVPGSPARIFLYGEKHGVDTIINQEYELWHKHYHSDGMRHLFLELPYFSAEFLNIWLQEDSDEILNALYDDLEGTAAHVPAVKEFYRRIKADCPDTVFHGTDVGHQFYSTGERYLEYLEQHHLEDSRQYALAEEAIRQGEQFYENSDFVYRENKMAENFIREFDSLAGERVMGIYGGSHTRPDALDYSGRVSCMAKQLKDHYGDIIYSEQLSGK
ncbi:MAG: hypothetical protein QM270_06500 [Bacillota bacterium]|nr:hypothetical protein [Bacillota bacterium]